MADGVWKEKKKMRKIVATNVVPVGPTRANSKKIRQMIVKTSSSVSLRPKPSIWQVQKKGRDGKMKIKISSIPKRGDPYKKSK